MFCTSPWAEETENENCWSFDVHAMHGRMDGWITGQLDRWMSVGASGTVHSSLQIELVTGF